MEVWRATTNISSRGWIFSACFNLTMLSAISDLKYRPLCGLFCIILLVNVGLKAMGLLLDKLYATTASWSSSICSFWKQRCIEQVWQCGSLEIYVCVSCGSPATTLGQGLPWSGVWSRFTRLWRWLLQWYCITLESVSQHPSWEPLIYLNHMPTLGL